ncbi:hypothetical protein [Fibrella arboris]|uniref:hypothetical protein n=1 Tax=Fibrella arboris TaxID=3242486 RepID=UPI0035222844
MKSYLQQIAIFLVAYFLVPISLVKAQPRFGSNSLISEGYQMHDDYYERIVYLGKKKDNFIVETYLKDSTLYSTASFTYNKPKFIWEDIIDGHGPVRHGLTKIMYPDGGLYLSCTYKLDYLDGAFMVFYPNGRIKRRGLYHKGVLKKSVCYANDGQEITCDLFFQPPEFAGDAAILTAYFNEKLMPIVDANVLLGEMRVVINEIGQVADVELHTSKQDTLLAAVIRTVFKEMPRWRENETNWKPARMDGVPIAGSWMIRMYRDGRFLRLSFPGSSK